MEGEEAWRSMRKKVRAMAALGSATDEEFDDEEHAPNAKRSMLACMHA